MKKLLCYLFGHKYVNKSIRLVVNSTKVEIRQCTNCGKITAK